MLLFLQERYYYYPTFHRTEKETFAQGHTTGTYQRWNLNTDVRLQSPHVELECNIAWPMVLFFAPV